MNRFLKYFLIGVVLVALSVGIGVGIRNFMDPTPKETGNKQFGRMIDYDGTKFVLNESYDGRYDAYEADVLYDMVHHMTHNVVIADEKWGNVLITEHRVNTALLIALASTDVRESLIGESVLQHLTEWKKGNFSNSAELHNLIWAYKGGTVGRATGVIPYTPSWEFNEADYQ